MTDIPSSGQSLKYCSTFVRRQAQATTLSQLEIELIGRYAEDIGISYLIMETHTLGDGKALLLSLLQQVRIAQRPVIWALRFTDFQNRSLCLEDILRILVVHALEINSNVLASTAFPISLPSLRAASSQADWLPILNRALAGLGEVYVIVDPDLLRSAAEDNKCAAADILLALKKGVRSTRLKIVISSFGINKNYFAQHSAAGSWKAIRTEGVQRQQLAKLKRQHLARKRKIKKP